MTFTIAALTLALLAAAWIVRPLAVARRPARSRAAHDEQVFRAQLAELDRDVERGVTGAEEARAARIEISRRLLAAAAERERSPDHAPAPKAASWALAAALVVGAPLAVWAVYGQIGAPGLPDQPLHARGTGARAPQTVAEAYLARQGAAPAPAPAPPPEYLAQIAELERKAEGGTDRAALWVLAQAYAGIGRYADAWRAYDRLVATTGGDAPAAVFTAMAEAMILAARGYVSPEAEDRLAEALRRDPRDPVARFYMGAALAQSGRRESAFEAWNGLIADSPAGAPWIDATREQILDLAAREGVEPPAIPAPRTPTPEEARALMADMVARLDARLAAEGGAAGDWLQLVKSLKALGDPAAADAAADRARAALAADAAQLAAFDEALAADALAPAADPGSAHGAEDMRSAVAALDARLAAEGGGPDDWLKLIASRAALGDGDGARDALARARAALADQPEALAALERAVGDAAPPAPGPTDAQVAAAAEMTPEDRMAMIRSMVSGLRDRLYAEGGTPEEWARLIQSQGVLGDVPAAEEAWRRAIEAHAGDRTAVSFLTEAAVLAGVRTQ